MVAKAGAGGLDVMDQMAQMGWSRRRLHVRPDFESGRQSGQVGGRLDPRGGYADA
jgi:hypothetical protein